MNQEEMLRNVEKELFSMQDSGYREFHMKLLPTVDRERIIGIRTPKLRAFAKKFGKTEQAEMFLEILPHRYYEENNLHGLLIEQIRDYEECVQQLERFLPFIDNWATCDMLTVKIVRKHPDTFIKKISQWLDSDHPYTVRFGISMLMKHYLDENFRTEHLRKVSEIRSGEYYVNMMRAWYFATALAKQPEESITYLEQKKLDIWTHNKTIQKAIESCRISPEQKEYLRTLRIHQAR